MKCYLGGQCVYTLQAYRELEKRASQLTETDTYEARTIKEAVQQGMVEAIFPLAARDFCMEFDCNKYPNMICKLADEYRELKARSNIEEINEEKIHITPKAYFKTMASIVKCVFLKPHKTSYIDVTTGEDVTDQIDNYRT